MKVSTVMGMNVGLYAPEVKEKKLPQDREAGDCRDALRCSSLVAGGGGLQNPHVLARPGFPQAAHDQGNPVLGDTPLVKDIGRHPVIEVVVDDHGRDGVAILRRVDDDIRAGAEERRRRADAGAEDDDAEQGRTSRAPDALQKHEVERPTLPGPLDQQEIVALHPRVENLPVQRQLPAVDVRALPRPGIDAQLAIARGPGDAVVSRMGGPRLRQPAQREDQGQGLAAA